MHSHTQTLTISLCWSSFPYIFRIHCIFLRPPILLSVAILVIVLVAVATVLSSTIEQ